MAHPPHNTTSDPGPEIILRWATPQDIPRMTHILLCCFLDFELHDHFVPTRRENQNQYYEFLLKRIKVFFHERHCRCMVAEAVFSPEKGASGTGSAERRRKVVGFASWEAQGSKNAVRARWMEERQGWGWWVERNLAQLEFGYFRHVLNSIVDFCAFDQLLEILHAPYERLEEFDPCLHLQYLMVDPVWQRGYGVGRRLLQWGIDLAREEECKIVIESSLAGYEFYLRMGCRLLERVWIGLVEEKAYWMPIVVWEPGEASLEGNGT